MGDGRRLGVAAERKLNACRRKTSDEDHFARQQLRVRRPTLAFSGAASDIEPTHENCATRPPLQRLVRCVVRIRAPVTKRSSISNILHIRNQLRYTILGNHALFYNSQ